MNKYSRDILVAPSGGILERDMLGGALQGHSEYAANALEYQASFSRIFFI